MKLFLVFFLLTSTMSLGQNPVVIELFTSQGCSSCPDADKNLAEIIDRAQAAGQQIYGLSFHVDYWNYIGWKDPYSKSEFTERQRKYAALMNPDNVYTPQMIVNGAKEFVGSNRGTSTTEVSKALQQKMLYQIVLGEVKQQNGKIIVAYSLDKNPSGEVINIAIVQRKISNEVTRGENSGRKLSHSNVVRSFDSKMAQKEGTLEIAHSSSLKDISVIIYLQDQQWHVTGASTKTL